MNSFENPAAFFLFFVFTSACFPGVRAPEVEGPFVPSDYIQSGVPGQAQAKIYRIALSTPGRALARAALAEIDGEFLPALTEESVDARAEKTALKKAISQMDTLVRLEPNSPCARELLGMLQYRAGAKIAALENFAAARELPFRDAYLRMALERWSRWVRMDTPLLYDGFVRQMFPGYELYLMEHRVRARAEGVYENHHVYVDGLRFGATPSRNQIFELLEHDDPTPAVLVLGSSRVREGIRPGFLRNELSQAAGAKIGGVLNLSYGGASTRFYLGALEYLAEWAERKNRKLPYLVLGSDLELMSTQGIAFLNPDFKMPLKLTSVAWNAFMKGSGEIELWPYWRFSSPPKAWRAAPWVRLQGQPRRYAFPAQPLDYNVNPEMLAQMQKILPLMKQVAEHAIVIEAPVPEFYNERWGPRSSRQILRELCASQGIPFISRTLSEWGLNDGHFYGSVIQEPDRFDYLHLNYPGSMLWSRAVGRILVEHH